MFDLEWPHYIAVELQDEDELYSCYNGCRQAANELDSFPSLENVLLKAVAALFPMLEATNQPVHYN